MSSTPWCFISNYCTMGEKEGTKGKETNYEAMTTVQREKWLEPFVMGRGKGDMTFILKEESRRLGTK